jgi:hypothetical protein
MALSFVVVCEARADFLTASELADHIFCDSVNWIEPDYLDFHRSYTGFPGDEPFLTWKRLTWKRLARDSGLRPRGFIEGQPLELDAAQARRALVFIESTWPDVDGILLIRDDDRLTNRRIGLEQARAASLLNQRIVIGLAHTKRECWVLAGFDARDDRERALLKEIKQELGFDPCSQSEQLTAIHDHDKRSAKPVLKHLVQSDKDREAACWKEAPLRLLRDRGEQTGLRHYLDEVEQRLVPLLKGPRLRGHRAYA